MACALNLSLAVDVSTMILQINTQQDLNPITRLVFDIFNRQKYTGEEAQNIALDLKKNISTIRTESFPPEKQFEVSRLIELCTDDIFQSMLSISIPQKILAKCQNVVDLCRLVFHLSHAVGTGEIEDSLNCVTLDMLTKYKKRAVGEIVLLIKAFSSCKKEERQQTSQLLSSQLLEKCNTGSEITRMVDCFSKIKYDDLKAVCQLPILPKLLANIENGYHLAILIETINSSQSKNIQASLELISSDMLEKCNIEEEPEREWATISLVSIFLSINSPSQRNDFHKYIAPYCSTCIKMCQDANQLLVVLAFACKILVEDSSSFHPITNKSMKGCTDGYELAMLLFLARFAKKQKKLFNIDMLTPLIKEDGKKYLQTYGLSGNIDDIFEKFENLVLLAQELDLLWSQASGSLSC